MGRDRLFRATVIFALAMIVYTGNGQVPWLGDTMPARYLPLSILQGHFRLDDYPRVYRGGKNSYWVKKVDGAWLSFYPVGAAIAAVPLYVPAVLTGTLTADADRDLRRMEKVAAATLVALSVALLYATLTMLTGEGLALAITLAYALGTSSMSVCSQGLWQHGPAQLAFVLGLLLLVKAREGPGVRQGDGRPWLVTAAGFPLAFAFVCRPTNLMPFVPLAAYVLLEHRRAAIGFLAAASLPFLFQIAYNVTYFGDPFWMQFPLSDVRRWHSARPLETLQGLLFSPGRGLFFYSPFLLFAIPGLVLALRPGGDRLLRAIGAGLVLALALYSRWWNWWGGGTYGPRLTADLTPLLALAIYPCAAMLRRSLVLRGLFAVTIAWSIFAHIAGAYWDDGTWKIKREGWFPVNMWHWTDNQAVNSLTGMAKAAADRLAWRTLPSDPAFEERLRRRAEKDQRRDGDWSVLRDLRRKAGDAEGAAALEELRRARFTPSERLDIHFEDQLTLLGIDHRYVAPSELEVTYYWRADRKLPEDYALYSRLGGHGCALRSEFVLGTPDYTTRRWAPGETFKTVDRLILPTLPEAGCRLQVGVWAPESKKKLYARKWPVWKQRATVLRLPPPTAMSPAP